MAITFAHVQSATGDADPAQATLTVTAGNKLVVVAMDRSGGSAASFTISDTQGGSWNQRVALTLEQGNGTFRRTLVVWERTVTAPGSVTVTVDDGTANTKRVVVSEFEHGAVSATWTFAAASNNNNGTTANANAIDTGTTSSVAAGDQLLVGILGWKDAGSSFDPAIAWTSSTLANAIDTHTSSGRGIHVAWAQESASGTKTSTATNSQGSTFNNGLASALLVFTASEGGGGSDTPIVVDHGSLAMAGQNVELVATGSIAVDTASLALESFNVGLLFDEAYVLPVEHRQLALEGQELVFILEQPYDFGQLVLEGSSISLPLAMAISNGSFALAGEDLTLLAADSFVLQVDSAALVLQSYDVALAAYVEYASGTGRERDGRRRGLLRLMGGRG